jgi:F-type H+-transporting ATPase subunit delta
MTTQAQPRDYARAIQELALESWTRQLGAVLQAHRQDATLRQALGDPSLDVQARLSRLAASVPGGLGDGVRRFLGVLLEAGELDQLEAILLEIDRLVKRRPEIQLAHVTSAVPLTAEEQEALRAGLTRKYGADLEFQFDVDASLIGGIYLRVGDQVIDGTVAGKLAALRDRLAA